ncbi:cytochrome d ubiquinol oxidase subunit II [Reinekea sp.]|jgi:cytochrome d ubiquinol oxidase subunit II|uniref:cytochrome d ubiquinol oxidase subunit II n=1 Tax=Reinekea sp. TaxID=1970455 RepID=UPI00398A2066
MLDYETLRIIWWLLIGVLLIGFAITDGFDLGVGALLTLVGKTDNDRRIMINTIGPHWDGNQVWLVTAGGAIFAAFPMIYATAFSSFYLALMLTLAALWMRPLGFDFRSKLENPKWRKSWDWALFFGGIVPALVFGIAFGNLLQGMPFQFDDMLKVTYTGNFFTLLNPFAILTGLVSVAMLLMHGSVWLQLKTDSVIHERAEKVATKLGIVTSVLFVIGGLWIAFGIDGYHITSTVITDGASNPLTKNVSVSAGGWLLNYQLYPWMILAPVVGVVSPLIVALLSFRKRGGWAFVASALSLAGIILTAGFAMFPFLVPSSSFPAMSLTIWDSSSSQLTLNIMFYVAMLFVPIVLGYTLWGFWTMRGRIKAKHIEAGSSHAIY